MTQRYSTEDIKNHQEDLRAMASCAAPVFAAELIVIASDDDASVRDMEQNDADMLEAIRGNSWHLPFDLTQLI